ncbi:demethoxyubiquinone hydroxylase family protein [Petroclostridium sp. X23]|uniref:ferritin-like domain-containing protein n=1 Tax=Petroclostridium sp. X23 TaxID=3045146 RepID=UPI0024AD61D0|nr:demethoxyubiquinone hydroxylase family protein [Petroclostridium sp. X23]WHH57992.1 ferritin-like domain-containing protein [Petroclostridium sp. X23]
MDKERLLFKLNWFYSFELNQVDLYTSQSSSTKDDYISLAFERIAYIEQQHVDNIADNIKELGGKPTMLGDMIAPIVGKTVGKILGLSGIENLLKINILLEQKAMQDYKDLIHAIRGRCDDKVVKILQSNLIDEDLHAAWFHNQLLELKE